MKTGYHSLSGPGVLRGGRGEKGGIKPFYRGVGLFKRIIKKDTSAGEMPYPEEMGPFFRP